MCVDFDAGRSKWRFVEVESAMNLSIGRELPVDSGWT